MKKANAQLFAIVRVENFTERDIPMQDRITVKEIVSTIEMAQSEVVRLNRINADKECTYFWQATRMVEQQTKERSKI